MRVSALLVVLLHTGEAHGQEVLAPAARADRAPLQLEWVAPSECPSRSWVMSRIAEAQQRPSALGIPGARAEVFIVREDEGAFEARVSVQGAVGSTGQRELRHPTDCLALAKGAALVIAIALDPRHVEAPPTPPPPNAGLPGRTASAHRFAVGLWGGARWGVMPHVAAAVGANASIRFSRARVDLGASFLAPQDVELVPSSTSVIGFSSWNVRGRACQALPVPQSLSIFMCAGMAYDRLQAQPHGLDSPSPARSWWISPLLAPLMEAPLGGGFAAVLSGELSFPLRHVDYRVTDYGEVLTLASIQIAGAAGIEAQF